MSLIPEKHEIIMKLLGNDEFVEDVWKFIEPRIKRVNNSADKTHVQYTCCSGKIVEEKKQSIIPHKIPIHTIINYAKIGNSYWILTLSSVYEISEMNFDCGKIDENISATAAKFLSFDIAGNLKFKIGNQVGRFNFSEVKFGIIRNGYLSVSTKDGSTTVDMRNVLRTLKCIIEKYTNVHEDESYSTAENSSM